MRTALFCLGVALLGCKHTQTSKPVTVLPTPTATTGSVHGGAGGLPAGKIIDTKTGQEISFEAMIASLSSANQVYVGEIHDDKLQHEAQLWVLKALFYQRPGQVAVGMEMFQRPFQPVLDLYVAGEIGEKAMIRETQYEQRWGYDFSLYRGILRFSLDHGVPVVALNAPTELVKKISKGGIEGLTPEERQQVPELDLNDAAHKARIKASFDEHPHGGNFDKFYTIQTLWDETMADSAVNFLKPLNGQVQMVIIAGHGHTDHGNGIPLRVKRRLPNDNFKIVVPMTIRGKDPVDIKALQQENLGDFIWLLSAPPEDPNENSANPHKKKSAD
jgi:uncharacterized iron-regulated protein